MQPLLWTKDKVQNLFEKPFFKLLHQAAACHQENFDPQKMEFCVLSSIKTGACPEDCAYCPQSGHYPTSVKKESLLETEEVLEQARQAKANGAKRFCMGAAWRTPPKKDFPKILTLIQEVKKLGLETCVTLGMLDKEQAYALKAAGLDYYNHNLDTSPAYYSSIITTRTYQDRLTTITHVGEAGINVCCGGILGMGEGREDRIEFLLALYRLPYKLKSIPINHLIPIPSTPLETAAPLDVFEFIRTIAVTRILFPEAKIRLSAGRESMSDEMQAWCFMAGANSLFIGEKLLTANNAEPSRDRGLFKRLNIPLPQTTVIENDER